MKDFKRPMAWVYDSNWLFCKFGNFRVTFADFLFLINLQSLEFVNKCLCSLSDL